jgi:hypothetical protein
LAYRIIDAGAAGGIIVSPLGLQEGAEKVAAAENVVNVTLNADCNPREYVMRFLNNIMVGVQSTLVLRDRADAVVVRGDGSQERLETI